MFSNSVWHIQSIEIEREIKIEKVWEVCIEGTQKGGGGDWYDDDTQKQERIVEHATPEWGYTLCQ